MRAFSGKALGFSNFSTKKVDTVQERETHRALLFRIFSEHIDVTIVGFSRRRRRMRQLFHDRGDCFLCPKPVPSCFPFHMGPQINHRRYSENAVPKGQSKAPHYLSPGGQTKPPQVPSLTAVKGPGGGGKEDLFPLCPSSPNLCLLRLIVFFPFQTYLLSHLPPHHPPRRLAFLPSLLFEIS